MIWAITVYLIGGAFLGVGFYCTSPEYMWWKRVMIAMLIIALWLPIIVTLLFFAFMAWVCKGKEEKRV